jgi:hypothetical protein
LKMPFGLRDNHGVVRHGCTGEIVSMPGPSRLARVGPQESAETVRLSERKPPASVPVSRPQNVREKALSPIFFKIVPLEAAVGDERSNIALDKSRHLPESLRNRHSPKLDGVKHSTSKIAPVFVKRHKQGVASAKHEQTGTFRCGDSGRLYYKHEDGRVSPRE